jgi:hypothetical protein
MAAGTPFDREALGIEGAERRINGRLARERGGREASARLLRRIIAVDATRSTAFQASLCAAPEPGGRAPRHISY